MTGRSYPSTSRSSRPLYRADSGMPCSSAATRVNGLKVEPAWAMSRVTEFCVCARSAPPHMPRTAPVAGSRVTVPTRSPGGSVSPSSSSADGRASVTAASVTSWTRRSYVETTRRPPVSISSALRPTLSTSSARTVSNR